MTDWQNYVTMYCIASLKSAADNGATPWGGESNTGFSERAQRQGRRVLTRVGADSVAARLGIIMTDYRYSYMNNVAHELGHFFSLPHAWEREQNQQRGITGLGTGPKGNVDGEAGYANVMDYDNGPEVRQYFSLTHAVERPGR